MKPVPNIFPSSDPGAIRLALIGEAPGVEEVAMGIPFSGKSGWWLKQWLSEAGIRFCDCFVGNVSQMRPSPTSNEFDLLEWNGPEVQAGIAALQRDLAAFKPNCVVALGNAALHLLRQGNVAPAKSAKLGLFQWPSRVGTWRGSLFEGARSFEASEALVLRGCTGRRAQLLYEGQMAEPPGCQSTEPPLTLLTDEWITVKQTFSQIELVNAINRLGKEHLVKLGWPIDDILNTLPAAPVLADSEWMSTAKNPVVAPGSPNSEAHDSTTFAGSRVAAGSLSAGAKPSCEGVPEVPLGSEASAGYTPADLLPASWKCLCTYHPAATFRDPSFVYPLVSDLRRAVAEASTPTLTLPRRDIVWNLSLTDIMYRCLAIRERRTPVGFDIEGGLKGLQCCSFATSPHEAFVIDLMERDFDYARKMAAIAAVLEDPQVPKVCWNTMYERSILEAVASIRLTNYEDGMLAWWERFSEQPKALDYVASILTREPYWAEGIGWDRRSGAPKVVGPPFWLYNGIDSCVTLEIWEHPLLRGASESRTPVPFAL